MRTCSCAPLPRRRAQAERLNAGQRSVDHTTDEEAPLEPPRYPALVPQLSHRIECRRRGLAPPGKLMSERSLAVRARNHSDLILKARKIEFESCKN